MIDQIRFHNGDLNFEIDKIKSLVCHTSITVNEDYNLDYRFILDVGDSSYFYANKLDRDSDYIKLKELLFTAKNLKKMIVKNLDDFLLGRNVNDFVFTVLDKYSNEKLTWDILDVLDEINRDRSAKWTEYTKDDWFDGWSNWCEDYVYKILSIEDKGDIIHKPFM